MGSDVIYCEILFKTTIIYHLAFILYGSEVIMSELEMISDYVRSDVQFIPATISGSEEESNSARCLQRYVLVKLFLLKQFY